MGFEVNNILPSCLKVHLKDQRQMKLTGRITLRQCHRCTEAMNEQLTIIQVTLEPSY